MTSPTSTRTADERELKASEPRRVEELEAPARQPAAPVTPLAVAAAADAPRAERSLARADLASRTSAMLGLQAHSGNAHVQRLIRSSASSGAAGDGGPGAIADGAPAMDAPESAEGGSVALDSTADALSPGKGGHGSADAPRPPASPPPPEPPAWTPSRRSATVQRDETVTVTAAKRDGEEQPLIPYEAGDNVLLEIENIDLLSFMVSGLKWDEEGQKRKLPPELYKPQLGVVMTDNTLTIADPNGIPVTSEARTGPLPVQTKTAFLIQIRTGDAWQILTRGGVVEKTVFTGTIPPTENDKITEKDSMLVIFMPGVVTTPEQKVEIDKRIKSGAVARKRAEGPPAWANKQAGDLRRKLKERRGAPPPAGAGDGPGQGDKGSGSGGGGSSDVKSGSGPLPTIPPTQVSPPKGSGADDVIASVDAKGDPIAVVIADRAKTTIPLRPNEPADSLEKRADAAGDALRADRDPNTATGIKNGATETGFVKPPAGAGSATIIDGPDAQQQAKSSGGRTPGERSIFDSDVNTAAWPATIKSYGMQPPEAPLTVKGATNDFTMEIDRGPSVLDYFQEIGYRWELIRVTNLTQGQKREALRTPVGGQRVGAFSGDSRDIGREMDNIREDWHNSSWDEIASEFALIGLSAGVRVIGSVVKAIYAVMTRPLNEQAIGFEAEGDYILRAVATPIVDREWLKDHEIPPEKWVIRASSVAVLPIRIQSLQARAEGANATEADAIARKKKELEEARAKGAKPDVIAELEKELAELIRRQGVSTPERLHASLADADRALKVLDDLEKHERGESLGDGDKADDRLADALFLDVGLRLSGVSRTEYRAQQTTNRETLGKLSERADVWAKDLATQYRPNVAFASEVNGQTTQMLMNLGKWKGDGKRTHWVLDDLTSPSTQDRYHGYSDLPGQAGEFEAIRNAFVNFRENGEYGRGTIAIKLPAELAKDLGGPVPVEATMRAAPGRHGREMERLASLAKAAMLAALVLTGPAALAVGAVGGVAGAAVAANRLARRSAADRLHLDWETFMDIVDIIGGVVAVVGVAAAVAGKFAKTAAAMAKEGASVAELRKAASGFKWVQRVEMAERGMHIFGEIQNIGQMMFVIPYSLMRELEAIDKEPKDAVSPGRRRARRAQAIVNAMQSGAIVMLTMAQMHESGMPEVTSDALVWDRLAEATKPGAETPPPSAEGGAHGNATGTEPPVAGSTKKPVPEPGPVHVVPIEPPSGVDASTTAKDTTAGKGAEEQGTGKTREELPGGAHGTAPTPATPQNLSANQVVAMARRIIAGDRSAPPPAGRIRYVPETEFAPLAGEPGAVGIHDPTTGILTISLERATAAGLVPRLRQLVALRAHPLSAGQLGPALHAALVNRLVPDVLVGDPGPFEHTVGDAILDRLILEVGLPTVLDTFLHGDIAAVRDRLRERLGNARADAVLAAIRGGSLESVSSLLQAPRTEFVDRYGSQFSAAVGDLITAEHGGTPRDPQRAAAIKELVDVVGFDVVRDAYATGDTARLDAALEAALGVDGAKSVRNALKEGHLADAVATMRGAKDSGPRQGPADRGETAGTGTGTKQPGETGTPATGAGETTPGAAGADGGTATETAPAAHEPIPERASAAATEFTNKLGSEGATGGPAGRTLLEKLANFKMLRRLVEGGALGTSAQRQAVKDSLQATRMAATNEVLAEIGKAVEQRHPGVEIKLQDLGTPGFSSDRDVTLRAEPKAGVDPAPTVNELVAASTEAVRDAYSALRERGFDPDGALDTNFYTELHEGDVQPASNAERIAIAGDQSIVSLTEMRMGMSDAQWSAHRQEQLKSIRESGAPKAMTTEMAASMERQFTAAEERAARLGRGEVALQGARQRLLDALGRKSPPATAREIRELSADVKLLEPDAYGTRAAVEGVVYGQQGMTRATDPAARAKAGEHLGPVGRGETTLPEQIANRAQQAEASLGHLAHFTEGHNPSASDVRAIAKQLGRVAHAFAEAGLTVKSRLIDETGAVVGAKQETDSNAATMRELRGWAEDSGHVYPNDEALRRAYAQEASRLATELSTKLRTSQELARVAHPEGDQGYQGPRPETPGGAAPTTPTTGSGSAPSTTPAEGGTPAPATGTESGTPVPGSDQAPTGVGGGGGAKTSGTAAGTSKAVAEPTEGEGNGSRPLHLLEAYQGSISPKGGVNRITDWFLYVARWTSDTGGFGTPPAHGYRTAQGHDVVFMEGGRIIPDAEPAMPAADFPVPRTRAEWAVAQQAAAKVADAVAARRAAATALEGLRRDTTRGANDIAANPGGPGEGPSLSTDAGGDPIKRPGNGPVEIELPSSSIITGGNGRPFTAADAEGVARNARRDRPYDEVGILRNLDTGDYGVVQGNNIRSGGDVLEKTLTALTADHPGTWIFVDHNHTIDAQSGVTPPHQRLPSGASGDFSYLADRAKYYKRPLEATLTYTDRSGQKKVRYGVDVTGTKPWVEGPGVPRREFASLREYGDWYELQFGKRPDGYDSIRKKGGSPAAPTSTIDTVGATGPLEPVGAH